MGLPRGIGPEIVAAASDNDPTNVGTAAAVGARTGYQLSWVALLVGPLLAVVLLIAAQVGMVARGDLQSLTRERYGRAVAGVLLLSVLLVNLATIAADLMAGAAGLGQLAGVDFRWLVAPLGALLIWLMVAGRYRYLMAVLRYLMLGFCAFGVALFLVHPDWVRVLHGTVVPVLTKRTAAAALALLGTTLTSYVYIWETIERGVEEAPGPARARAGAVTGGLITAALLWCMLVVSAATLNGEAVATAGQAAAALKPVAGQGAADLYAAGLVTSALVALPVLMATTAHVVGAQFGWRRGLSERAGSARGFYAVLAASVGLALVLALAGASVISTLEAASVLGGLGTPIGLAVLVRLARDPRVMGTQPISRRLAAAGWAVTAAVAGLSVLVLISAVLT
jgi:Mn2+/Fe2+ NRAMP family transporter